MPTKKLAKISASQMTCIRLHELGELDDNFLPIKEIDDHDLSDQDDQGQEHDPGRAKAGTKQSKQIYSRKVIGLIYLLYSNYILFCSIIK